MPIERRFVDWQLPALETAADVLTDRPLVAASLDLANVVVALPGSRAGRRLLEILVSRAEERSLALIPPQMITTGQLPELLYEAQKPFADDLTQQLAWIEALQATDRTQLSHVVAELPNEDDLFGWLSLGEMLSRLHRELAADGLNFSNVLERGASLPGFDETRRWQMLAEIQAAYLRVLDGLELWDLQTARLFAIEHEECQTDREILLVGAVDLNRVQRAMLDQVSGHVTALVFSPAELADRFDEHGCLRPKSWQDARIDLARDQIEVVDAPGDQSDAVVRAVAALDGAYSPDEITVGVPDERLVPYIRQRLDECGVPQRYGVGVPLSRLDPFPLLSIVADYLNDRRPAGFAALVRHPAIADWLADAGIEGDWLTELDHYYGTHLPMRLSGPGLRAVQHDDKLLQRVYEKIDGPNGLLRELSDCRKPLGEWGESINRLLVSIYGRAKLDRNREQDRTLLAVCDKIQSVLQKHLGMRPQLMPSVSGVEALRLTLRALEGERIPPRPDHAAVELLGWLELPLDDAPVLVVSGFNEGLVPASKNSDLFLPNELRRQLGLEDNDRIYARDAYALSVLSASRKSLKIIAGRRSVDNDPLSPSRLLFACPEKEMARRTIDFFSSGALRKRRVVLPGSLRAGPGESRFAPPLPLSSTSEVTSMRVTEFRDYLACPYRYYLRHRLKLESVDDFAEELSGGDFGSLLHDVLREFGQSDVSESQIAGEITDVLDRVLDRQVERQFGKNPLSAVRVQVEQIRLRLRAFSAWQAEWVGAGWRILLTETDVPDGAAPFAVDDLPMYLRGRIDRIDRNEATGQWVILDYKTGESAKTPDKSHRSRGDWVDLQLPLYRHLVEHIEEIDIDGSSLQLGYIVIPKAASKIAHHFAEWTHEDLAQADETAREVIRNIRTGRFWPPAETPPAFFEEFAAICQDEQFGAAPAADQMSGRS